MDRLKTKKNVYTGKINLLSKIVQKRTNINNYRVPKTNLSVYVIQPKKNGPNFEKPLGMDIIVRIFFLRPLYVLFPRIS